MSHRQDHIDRLPVNLIRDDAKTALPEYFVSEYPNIVAFLDAYYVNMEEDDVGFSYIIQTMYQSRDIESNSLKELDMIFREIGFNTTSPRFLGDAREIAKRFAQFYRLKGRELSAESFFRAFFNEEVSIEHPKNNMFIVGESKCGPDSLHYIQDDERYQIFSILIKSGQPIARWLNLFKKFVHPAGFYIAGDIVIETSDDLLLTDTMPLSLPDSDAGTISVPSEFTLAPVTLTSITGIIPDDGDSDLLAERIRLDRNVASFASLTAAQIDDQYASVEELIDPNSPTFDADSDGSTPAIDMSNTLETMDMNIFDYGIPSIYQDSA